MNIAFVLSYMDDRFGGPVTAVKKLGGVLTDMGHEVSYWAPGNGYEPDSTTKGLVHVYPYGWPRSWRRSKGLTRGLSSVIGSIDIVHVSELWLHSTYVASRLAAAHDVPYVLRPAGCLEPWRLQRGRVKSLKKRAYLKCLGGSIIGRAACLEAASLQEVEGIRLVGCRNSMAVVPHGVDRDAFGQVDASEAEACWPRLRHRPVVLFMSRLSPDKGLDLLIPVWAKLVKTGLVRDAILVIAGPDYRGYAETIGRMIHEYKIAPHVLVTGMVQGSRKWALLRRSDVFVLPSYSENFGIVVAEALACETPVVTTTETPWQEIETVNAGRWISPDKASLANTLGALLDMSAVERQAMGRRGRSFVEEKYSWDSVSQKFIRMCDCVLRGKPVPLNPEPISWVI